MRQEVSCQSFLCFRPAAMAACSQRTPSRSCPLTSRRPKWCISIPRSCAGGGSPGTKRTASLRRAPARIKAVGLIEIGRSRKAWRRKPSARSRCPLAAVAQHEAAKPLPSLEATRRLAVSLPPGAHPAADNADRGIPPAYASSLGMSAGSSGRRRPGIMMSPRAATRPLRMPRLWPGSTGGAAPQLRISDLSAPGPCPCRSADHRR